MSEEDFEKWVTLEQKFNRFNNVWRVTKQRNQYEISQMAETKQEMNNLRFKYNLSNKD